MLLTLNESVRLRHMRCPESRPQAASVHGISNNPKDAADAPAKMVPKAHSLAGFQTIKPRPSKPRLDDSVLLEKLAD